MRNPSEPATSGAYLRADEGVPLGALGLPLAEARRLGVPDDLFFFAIRKAYVPPFIDTCVSFADPSGAGNLRDLRTLFDRGMGGSEPHEVWRSPRVHRLKGPFQLTSLVPYVGLPATGGFWVFDGDIIRLLLGIAEGDVRFCWRPDEEGLHAPAGRQPYAVAVADAAGPVTPAQVRAFFVAFPDLAEELIAQLRWSGTGGRRQVAAREANSAAQRRLHIPVDVRNGSLVSRDDVTHAICCAAADVVHRDGRRQKDRLAQFVAALVPVVGAREAGQAAGLEGAASSRAVDGVLNSRLVWSRRADLQFIWYGEEPDPRRLAA